MPTTPCHIIVEGNPVVIFASRNGSPERVLPILTPFLDTFWQERDASGKSADTPECLTAQIVVRFGFEICEDDFSNLKVGIRFDPQVKYLYEIKADRTVQVWTPTLAYQQDPSLGLAGCQQLVGQAAQR